MKKKTVHNISDIARLAGVSKSTVSRALNDSPLIGQETRERIQAIAAIDVIREHGRRVPEDVAVIGYDDLCRVDRPQVSINFFCQIVQPAANSQLNLERKTK